MARVARRAGTIAARAVEATASTESGGASRSMPEDARARREAAKRRLVEACAGTYRGAATREDTEEISAAQGALERTVGDERWISTRWTGSGDWCTRTRRMCWVYSSRRRGWACRKSGTFSRVLGAKGTNTGITNEIRLSLPFLLSEAKAGAPGAWDCACRRALRSRKAASGAHVSRGARERGEHIAAGGDAPRARHLTAIEPESPNSHGHQGIGAQVSASRAR